MSIALITGSYGLIGCEASLYFGARGLDIVGVDNDMRAYYFGKAASTKKNSKVIARHVPRYKHHHVDIRNFSALEKIFKKYAKNIKLVIHAASQPSHDWAGIEPLTDFSVNATSTLNVLELSRRYCPKTAFAFISTNKVYGDAPNALSYKKLSSRWDLDRKHPLFSGIDETMPIDGSMHSVFGVSKAAADLMVQEYGRYYGLKTLCLRAGCLTGPRQTGIRWHGFLSYLMKCALTRTKYTIYGFEGKQVRDNIHSLDVVRAIDMFYKNPSTAAVYNIGGGRENSCSVLEAIQIIEEVVKSKIKYRYHPHARKGDHIWYITNYQKFQTQYPQWRVQFSLKDIITEMFNDARASK